MDHGRRPGSDHGRGDRDRGANEAIDPAVLVAVAALHHAQGQTGSVVSEATEGKASALRPLFVERESRLRKLAGLPVEGQEKGVVADTTADLLRHALAHSEFQGVYLTELAKR